MRRSLLGLATWLALAAIGLAAAWIRYAWIEQAEIGQACLAGSAAWHCSVRAVAIAGFQSYALGYAALAATLLAVCVPRPVTAWLAAACGLPALVLYCVEPGALALLVGVLRLARLQYRPRQHAEHAHTQP